MLAGWTIASHVRWFLLAAHDCYISSESAKMGMQCGLRVVQHAPCTVVQSVVKQRTTKVKQASCLESAEYDRFLELPEMNAAGELDRLLLSDKVIACIAVSCGMWFGVGCA